MNAPKRLIRFGLIVAALLLITAACQSEESTPESSPAPTETPRPTRELPPTWTPAPTTTPILSTSTLVPTFTPRPTLTVTPGVTPGVALLDDGSLSVIAEEAALNEAIRTVYQNAPPEQLSMSPEIQFPYSGRAIIDLVFFNDFLNQRGTITTEVLLDVQSGRVVLSEITDEREQEGILVGDDSIRQALALVETGINNAILEMAQSQPGDYQIASVQTHTGRLDVLLSGTAELTPVG